MDNQSYAHQKEDAEKPVGQLPSGPTMARAVLPPINITPGLHGTQTNQASIPQRPAYPTQPQMGYVPPRAAYTVPPTVAQPYDPNPDYSNGPRPAWAHNCALVLSSLLIISGMIMFIMNIVGLVVGVKFAVGGAGIWGGLFMILTGGIGVCASKTKTTCKIVSLMVLAILLAVFSFCIFGAHVSGTIVASIGDWDYMDKEYPYHYDDYNDYMPSPSREYIYDYNCTHPYETVNGVYCDGFTAYREVYHDTARAKTSPIRKYVDDVEPAGQGIRIAFNATMTIFALIVFVACIVASALSCRAVCCRSRSNVIQVVYVPTTGSCQMNPISQGNNLQVVSVAPHGQLQPQYVQNQGMVQSQNMAFSPQNAAIDYNQVKPNETGEQARNATGGDSSPPPAYEPYGRNEITAVED